MIKKKTNFMMKLNSILTLTIFVFLFANLSSFAQGIEGRWDITITKNDKQFPSWLEVSHSGSKYLIGRFVAKDGSARPISRVYFNDNKMKFSIPPQWEQGDKDFVVEGELKDGSLAGTMTMPNGEIVNWVGVQAPVLIKMKEPIWGVSKPLFNGKNLNGWEAFGSDNQWIVENGVLKSPKSGANIKTTKKFNDFKLHVEFRIPEGSNSGVYLRGRYEVQIEDGFNKKPSPVNMGGVYGFIQPLVMAAKKAGEWQTYDITLVGRVVTVVLNGKTIIYKNEIPGITGGAIDSNEAEAGPIMFQGDHGPVEFRNIRIALAK